MFRTLLILLLFTIPQVGQKYPLKHGRPTTRGIEQYVEEQSEAVVREYQEFIDDTLYNIYIYTADLTENGYYDSTELGRYYPNEIFVTNTEVFMAYELKDLNRVSRNRVSASNLFVKSTIIHELTHHYIYQTSIKMSHEDHIPIHRSYQTFFRIYRRPYEMGAKFIEEGICEYVTGKMGEIIPPRNPFIPKDISDLTGKEHTFNVYYKYSAHYLTAFLDTTGLERGIKILLHNAPPSSEEILDPELFFTRLQGIR